jgi:hypothetical protein
MMDFFINLIGWAGVALLIIAYGVVSTKRCQGNSTLLPDAQHHWGIIADHQFLFLPSLSLGGSECRLGGNWAVDFDKDR